MTQDTTNVKKRLEILEYNNKIKDILLGIWAIIVLIAIGIIIII